MLKRLAIFMLVESTVLAVVALSIGLRGQRWCLVDNPDDRPVYSTSRSGFSPAG